MIYKAPFYAMQKAVYAAFSQSSIDLQWYDSAVPIEEIAELHKNQAEFAYGIMGTQDADCETNKDTAFWNASIRLDVYSNYKGKKVVTKTLEALLNYFCSDGYYKLQEVFAGEGFALTSLSIGALVVNAPMYSDIGVWQSGGTRLTFKLTQMKEE